MPGSTKTVIKALDNKTKQSSASYLPYILFHAAIKNFCD
jgi:hypothetical protein